MEVFNVLIWVALAVTFGILCFGIYSMFKGGDFSRSWSNKMMRLRVVSQFIAILILVADMLAKEHFGK
jgi:hypothetical protein